MKRADKVYERLLQIYPSAYRRRFGSEMRQLFRDIYKDNADLGRPPWRLWGRTLVDLGVGAATQYGELIRSEPVMKQFFSNSANQKTFWWGVILMVPAGLFFLVASMSSLLNYPHLSSIRYQGATLYLFMVCLILLPLLAVLINAAPLVQQATLRKAKISTWNFVSQNFWTLAIMLVGLGWIAFLFGHDTVGCTLQYLPHLKWQAFQHCNATH